MTLGYGGSPPPTRTYLHNPVACGDLCNCPCLKNAKFEQCLRCASRSFNIIFVGGDEGRRRASYCDTPPTKRNGVSRIMDIEDEVMAHTRRVQAGERVRYGQACPHCGAAEEDGFRLHDCRRRKFRLVLGRCIHVALSWILRWHCLRCGKLFTDYPPFALPRKRFIKQPVLEKANENLGTDHSYRKTVEYDGMPIMYDDRSAVAEWQPVGLAPSTVWRWLSWLGGMRRAVRAATGLIRKKEPDAPPYRKAWAVPTGKYRSRHRRVTLQRAMQVLVVDRMCGKLFGKGLFPRFATAKGGP